jgi:hypothetical protein
MRVHTLAHLALILSLTRLFAWWLQVRVAIVLRLSFRVLAYMRLQIWGAAELPDDSREFAVEPAKVRGVARWDVGWNSVSCVGSCMLPCARTEVSCLTCMRSLPARAPCPSCTPQGKRALLLRRWFEPRIVYYNGQVPTFFDTDSKGGDCVVRSPGTARDLACCRYGCAACPRRSLVPRRTSPCLMRRRNPPHHTLPTHHTASAPAASSVALNLGHPIAATAENGGMALYLQQVASVVRGDSEAAHSAGGGGRRARTRRRASAGAASAPLVGQGVDDADMPYARAARSFSGETGDHAALAAPQLPATSQQEVDVLNALPHDIVLWYRDVASKEPTRVSAGAARPSESWRVSWHVCSLCQVSCPVVDVLGSLPREELGPRRIAAHAGVDRSSAHPQTAPDPSPPAHSNETRTTT